jgi:hypothetical protein
MLVWAEPFDQYGGSNAFLGQQGYGGNLGSAMNGAGRTGSFAASMGNGGWVSRALDNPGVSTLGQGWAFNPNNFQADGLNNHGTISQDSAGGNWRCVLLGNGDMGIYNSANTLVGRTPPNMIIPNAYTWVEWRVTQNPAGLNTGSAEIRINGIQRLVVNGLNVPNGFSNHQFGGFGGITALYDDWIVWDNTGLYNNTFMGDRRLDFSATNSNGALQDFTPSVGNAWDCVNNIPPVDTIYIEGAAAGNVSEFGKTGVTLNSNDIAAVVACVRWFKTDAGTASGRVGINSAGNVVNSGEIFPGTTGTGARFVIERDPNGTIPWTKAAVDAANLRVTRVQ